MAEAHPVGFQWVMEAKRRGATVIHVDPRFTRTSAVADLHVPIRAGTDIAFLGGLIHHVLETGAYFEDYVRAYTNAPMILRDDFCDTEDLDGLFSGFDPETGTYDVRVLGVQGRRRGRGGRAPRRPVQGARARARGDRRVGRRPDEHETRTATTPCNTRAASSRCSSGTSPATRRRWCTRSAASPPRCSPQVAEALTRNSGRERTSAFCYAVGWTHHTVGVQYIRAASILQMLLGNIGRPGGGILALRGHASIQGSTDIPTLFDMLPGYIPMPHAHREQNLETYIAANTGDKGFWGNMDAYVVSLLKAWFGDAATPDNDFCFDHLPRLDGDHSSFETVMAQVRGEVPGYFVIGENPAIGTANARQQRHGLAKLEWLVVRDLNMIETATFWKDGPEIATGELRTADIGTEVFFLPAAAHSEKDGTFTNTQRLLQWHHKAVEPPGDCRSDLWFYYELGRRIKERARGLHRSARPPAAGPHLGLPRRRERRAERGRRPARDQRHGRRRQDGERVHGVEERRVHRVRLLDLLRRVRRRGQPVDAPPSRPGAGPRRRRVGLGVADEPPGPLQPGLRRPRGQAVERAQEADLVGRQRLDRRRRARLPGRHRTDLPPTAGRPRRGGHRRRRAVHHAGRRTGLAARARRAVGRADAHALRAPGIPGAQRALPRRAAPTPPASSSSGPTTPTTRRPARRAPRCSRSCSPRSA